MLVPVNLKNDVCMALSIVRTPNGYSVLPCRIVDSAHNWIGLPSWYANMGYMNDEETGDSIEPDAIIGLEPDMKVEGSDLYNCIKKVLIMLENKYNM